MYEQYLGVQEQIASIMLDGKICQDTLIASIPVHAVCTHYNQNTINALVMETSQLTDIPAIEQSLIFTFVGFTHCVFGRAVPRLGSAKFNGVGAGPPCVIGMIELTTNSGDALPECEHC